MHIEVTRCGELESEIHSPRNPIGRPGTNENRVFWKHVILEWFFPRWQSTQDILSLSQWPILIMVHMRVLKRKARTEVEGWLYSSKDSWSWVIKYSFEIRHWQMGECLGNFVRIHSVHSKLKSVLEQLRINVYRCALLCWLYGSLSNVWNIKMSSRK